jgi:hypothetical protein
MSASAASANIRHARHTRHESMVHVAAPWGGEERLQLFVRPEAQEVVRMRRVQ